MKYTKEAIQTVCICGYTLNDGAPVHGGDVTVTDLKKVCVHADRLNVVKCQIHSLSVSYVRA